MRKRTGYIGLCLAFCLLFPLLAHGQQEIGYSVESNGDTLYMDRIGAIYVFNKPANPKSKDWIKYYKTVYNFNKAYPYAVLAARKISWADSLLSAQDYSARQKEKVVRSIEKALFQEFEKPLRKLTVTQGAMLMRLIDREVGQSTYYIIKGYRGGATASVWQGVAKLFGNNLKTPYDRYGEDQLLEELVHMYRQGSFYYLYASLFGSHRASQDVLQVVRVVSSQ